MAGLVVVSIVQCGVLVVVGIVGCWSDGGDGGDGSSGGRDWRGDIALSKQHHHPSKARDINEPPSLAVVIPFTKQQSDIVIDNLENLWTRFPPCDVTCGGNYVVDDHGGNDDETMVDRYGIRVESDGDGSDVGESRHRKRSWWWDLFGGRKEESDKMKTSYNENNNNKNCTKQSQNRQRKNNRYYNLPLPVDLIFYYHKDILRDEPYLPGRLKRIVNSMDGLRRCFGNVKFVNARLSEVEDAYPLGASRMFFKFMILRDGGGFGDGDVGKREVDREGNAARLDGDAERGGLSHELTPSQKQQQQHDEDILRTNTRTQRTRAKGKERSPIIWYMEPDNKPCRKYWLPKLLMESHQSLPFWIRGSMLRNGNEQVSSWTFAEHINGNALYHRGDVFFQRYLRVVERMFWNDTGAYLNSFDGAMEL
ncbi:hypothetical protein HDU76_009844, partial [Blyttiomyces sp. JEL0837]